ncbi:MAG TPA: NAD(P)-dependent oxidoreductase [Dongiaceae bacterium]|jgi:uroporphyrin-III C-methyltransferase/precorrin-2 dehydrogenase/sirohydrochlorin ferrochelatase|nr:NAD(P)-dependent oxidoreductase [Dongiaceae bacterium]
MNAVSPRSDALADGGLAYLPVFFGMRGRAALLIGGGEAALAKLTLLRRANARVQLVAQQMDHAMADAIAGDRMVVPIREPLAAHHFDDAILAIDASGDDAINCVSVSLARAAGVPINVVDRPALCDFILPAILDRAPMVVAISTGGLAPALARLVRQRLETVIPAGFGRIATLAASVRHLVRDRLDSPRQRAGFWEGLFDGPATQLAMAGHMEGAVAAAHALIDRCAASPDHGATTCTLDIGSENPDLLTIRAARIIRAADIIFYDPSIAGSILELARRDAAKIKAEANSPWDWEDARGSLEGRARRGASMVYLRAAYEHASNTART